MTHKSLCHPKPAFPLKQHVCLDRCFYTSTLLRFVIYGALRACSLACGGVTAPKEAEYIPNPCPTVKTGCNSAIPPGTGMGWGRAHGLELPMRLFSHDFIPSPSKPPVYLTSSAARGSSFPNFLLILKAYFFSGLSSWAWFRKAPFSGLLCPCGWMSADRRV